MAKTTSTDFDWEAELQDAMALLDDSSAATDAKIYSQSVYEEERSVPEQTYPGEPIDYDAAPAPKKRRKKHTFVWILLAIALTAVLTAGGLYGYKLYTEMQAQKAAEELAAQQAAVEEMSLTNPTQADFDGLAVYPNLHILDLPDADCYDLISAYRKAHPNVEVIYTVDIGGNRIACGAEMLELKKQDFQVDTLRQNLKYLENMKSVTFPDMQLTLEEYNTLVNDYPGIRFQYTVKLGDKTVDSTATELNLAYLTDAQVDSVLSAVEKLPNVTSLELMADDGTTGLSLESAAKLAKALPECKLHYSFELFEQQVSTDDEEIRIKNKRLSDEYEPELRKALDVLKNCKRLVLDNCHFSDDCLVRLRNDYRGQTKIVWRVYFGSYGSCLTDKTVIRFVYNLFDSNCSQLRYCEDAEYIDFGHNEFLTDCSWVSEMKNLKAIILSGSSIKSLEPFAGCESLEFLEIAYCGFIEDVSPLANCKNLSMLNISFTKVNDLSSLDDNNLSVVMAVKTNFSAEARAHMENSHPDALFKYDGNEYGVGWRYEEENTTGPAKFTPMYQTLKEVFNYPNATDTNDWS